MDFDRYHKPIFVLSLIGNAALWLLVLFVLLHVTFAPVQQPFGVVFAFGSFAFLFVLFIIALFFYWRTNTFVSLVFTVVFMVGQFICVLVTTISIFSDERVRDKIYFSENPVQWITNHRWLPILFSVVFLPIIAIQSYVINLHAQSPRAPDGSTEYQRKATPYHGQQKGQHACRIR
ncbi:hypothetical protein M3Y97_00341300 [Aphelenchoides bicaudatus]|nr:hypothetical protein M3Y97_00341300 [Aphelenchoides bicaudatus]